MRRESSPEPTSRPARASGQDHAHQRATPGAVRGSSLDRNPIHWDEPFAKKVGLPDVIAHGMFTMGSAVTVVSEWVGDAGRVVEYSVRFTKPVVVPYEGGADVAVEGVVKAVDAEASAPPSS